MRDQEIVGLWEAYHQVYAPQKNSEEVELWVNQLVEEGYDLSEYTWDDMVEIYEDQMLSGKPLRKRGMTPENRRDWKEMVRKYGPEPITNPRPTGKSQSSTQSSTRSASKVSTQSSEAPKRKRRTNLSDVQIKENRGERDHGERYGSHEQGPPINRARGRAFDRIFASQDAAAARAKREGKQRLKEKGKVHKKDGKDMFEHILAAQYFYEMGLNENGIEILIEELGVSQFTDFVYDIAEESLLVEARAGGSRIEPKLASGKAIEGKPKAASLKRLRAQKEARREAEEKASAAKPSGLRASLQRQSAIANAKKEQPKKRGVLDRIAGAVLAGMERDKAAREKFGKAARETGAVIQKAAKGAGYVAREFGSGMSTAAKVGKRVVTGEEVELWVNQLVEEGYDLSEYSWDDMYEIYMNEGYKDLPASKMIKQATKHGQRGGMAHIAQREVERTPKGLRTITGSREKAEKLGNIKRSAYTKSAKMTVVSQHHDPESSKEKASINRARGTKSNIRPFTRTAAEEVELWVNQLVEEGYDLSEYTWDDMYEIYLDEAYQEPRFKRKDYLQKLSKRGGMGMGTPNDPHGYRDPKMAKVGAEFSKRKTAAANAKKTGEPDTYRAEKESKSKLKEEHVDPYNIILSYLIDKGYADTHNDANVIIKNMSEEWKQSIIGEQSNPAYATQGGQTYRDYHNDGKSASQIAREKRMREFELKRATILFKGG